MRYINTLTGLRGVATLIVFISHSANVSLLPRFLGKGFGQTGVMLFFVLSGFLLTYLYIDKDFDKQNVKRYLLARIGRVFPLYFLLLVVSIIITHFASPGSFYPFKFSQPGEIARALLLIEAKYVFWAVPVEVQFYIVFIGFWALRKKGLTIYWSYIYFILTMIPTVIVYHSLSRLPLIVSTFSYAFFLGSITALFFEKILQNAGITKVANIIGFPALGLLFINLPELRYEYGLVFGEDGFYRTWGDPITWVIVYTVFVCAALNSASLFVLNKRFFMYLGRISYGFYLIHVPVLTFFAVKVNIASPVKFILAFFMTVAFSHLALYLFEKPVERKIRNFRQPTSS